MVRIEERKVFVAETRGRAFLTVRGALRAEAFARIRKERCDCDGPDFATGYPGATCYYHARPETDDELDEAPSLAERIADRYADMWSSAVRRAARSK
jgi:hypothetical protein